MKNGDLVIVNLLNTGYVTSLSYPYMPVNHGTIGMLISIYSPGNTRIKIQLCEEIVTLIIDEVLLL